MSEHKQDKQQQIFSSYLALNFFNFTGDYLETGF